MNLESRIGIRLGAVLLALLALGLALAAFAQSQRTAFLPVLLKPGARMLEVRGLWITRFDWTTPEGADPARVDEIVSRAAAAGFNTLYFQVRAEGDAYYMPGLEPWARRLSGTLGQDPGWDPLARLIERGHAAGLEVHAYLNVYPLWTGCEAPPDGTSPRHFYYRLAEMEGVTAGKVNSLQWDAGGSVSCAPYQRATPASVAHDDHILAVTADLVQRYDLDGLHLDHVRYAGKNTSCDPTSAMRYGRACDFNDQYADWQRQQVNATVRKIYEQVLPLRPGLWLTATAWPVYQDKWGWGVSSGYDTYYQDAKAWLAGGYVDGVTPMIYSGSPNCNTSYFWDRARWALLVADYQEDSNGRYVIPGIGVEFCTADDFAEIAARIEMARSAGVAGHAIFSYSGLLAKDYFDDLAAGPYRQPADVPPLTWHP
jgi:uncharacterized lipoprotein YddW (UPF0748 family)